MAYDKVVDSSVLNAGLTNIANAIRAKGGTSGQFAFPDGFVSAVQAIEAGGGTGVVSGTITPAASDVQTITHGLGKQPTGILIFQDNKSPSSKTEGVYAAFGDQNGQGGVAYIVNELLGFFPTSISEFSANCFITDANAETFKVALFGSINTVVFTSLIAGIEYRWYAW